MLNGKNNEEKIYNYLISKINNAYGVAGLMGNLRAESALNPHNLQNSFEKRIGLNDEQYTAAVDKGTYTNFIGDSAGYGLAQWTSRGRKEGFYNFVKACKCSIGDLEAQLNYLYYELSTGYTAVLNILKTAQSVKEASDCVLTKFERPRVQDDSVKNKRASYGQEYYNKYSANKTVANKVIIKESSVSTRVVIGSAKINENGKTTGGLPGDQTGKEVATQDFYQCKYGWYILRPINEVIALALAQAMLDVCYNNYIGYSQEHRNDIIEMLRKYGKMKNIVEFTEADCSSLVRACLMEAGICVKNFDTGNEADVLEQSGDFEKRVPLTDPSQLCVGDIIVTQQKLHTAIVVQGNARGNHVSHLTPIYVTGTTYTTAVNLNVRTLPSTDAPKLAYEDLSENAKQNDVNMDGALDKGTRVTCLEIRYVGSDIWMRIPSGWIAAYHQGKTYVI